MRLPVRVFALLAYAAFLGAFAYFVAFVGDLPVPRAVDSGTATSPAAALAVDLGLVAFFGVVHSAMARAGFKRAWTRVVPAAAERSVYVLVASLQMALLCWQWRPLAAPVLWAAPGAAPAALRVLQALGWAIALASTFLLDHFELFGLRQAFRARPADGAAPVFRTPLLYRLVRHPLYLGFLVALWSAPTMTAGHLLLAASMTAYVLVGIHFEERDLVRTFGDAYLRYRETTPMLLPLPRRPRRRLAVERVPE